MSRPVDLGHVCRGIRRRQYSNTRDIRLDMWRVFANCVKFHSNSSNKDAVPSFVSIALHLREFFNNLWQEHMIPSEIPPNAPKNIVDAVEKRNKDRQRNLENSGILILTKTVNEKTASLLDEFLQNGGRVDALDTVDVLGPNAPEYASNSTDLDVVKANLGKFKDRLLEMPDGEYAVYAFNKDLQKCYSADVLEDNASLRHKIANRLNRFMWKLLIPLHEANARGVTQSSIWGNIAATIWARESSKKPYWPALCLGILPPDDQREGWHDAVTERNESRLPEKLRAQLDNAKKKCIQLQKKQGLSYFLVEFLGTHEFIWVRETDIVENFNPDDDVNKKAPPPKSKKQTRASRGGSVVGSPTYQTALEECIWAMEEYESVLNDATSYYSNDPGKKKEEGDIAEPVDEPDMNYSYAFLSKDDEEADNEDSYGYSYDIDKMTQDDLDEVSWLLGHDGLLDTAVMKKNNKRKSTTPRKKGEKVEAKKDTKPKPRSEDVFKEKEKKELEKRRKKRMREREKALRLEEKKSKRFKSNSEAEDDERGLSQDKRARATAIARAYLARLANDEKNKSLALGGVLNMPLAMIEPTGLLSMALAFRAVSGEIAMPDDSREEEIKRRPWLGIDTEKPLASSERVEGLKQQVSLLQKRLEQVRANTLHRKKLTAEAIARREQVENDIKADEEAARLNHFKKRKRTPSKTSTPPPAVAKDGPEQERDVKESSEEKESLPGGMKVAGNPSMEEATSEPVEISKVPSAIPEPGGTRE